jgi:hypothetical protein
MKTNSKNLLLITIIFIIVVLGCSDKEGEQKRKETKEAMEKLSAVAGDLAKLPPKEQLTNEPYIKGKVVMVRQNEGGKPYVNNMDNGQFGETYARTPEEVQTVALVNCSKTQKGNYRTNENPPRELPAFSTDCNLTLIDRTIPAVIFKKRFEAKLDEKAGVTAQTKEVNSYAEHEMSDFLKALPRK